MALHSSCIKYYKALTSTLLYEVSSIVLSDANAHFPLWSPNIPEDRRGANLDADTIHSSFTSLNDHRQTRLAYDSNSLASSHNVSLASSSIFT